MELIVVVVVVVKAETVKYTIEMRGNGFIQLNSTEFYREFDEKNHYHNFAVTFSTRQKNGVIMRQEDLRRHFWIEIRIIDGFLYYKYSLLEQTELIKKLMTNIYDLTIYFIVKSTNI